MRNCYVSAVIATLSLVVSVLTMQQADGQKANHQKQGHSKSKQASSSSALVARGKAISTEKRCNTCHGVNLEGKPKFAPSLHASGELRDYNEKTFAQVMDTGVTNDGKKVKPPMPVYHLSAKDSAALYAYLKTLK